MLKILKFFPLTVFVIIAIGSFLIPSTFANVQNDADKAEQPLFGGKMGVGLQCYYGDYYFWQISDTIGMGTITKGNWVLRYSGYPATADGEVDTIGFSVSYNHELSGTVNVPIGAIEAEIGLGYAVGDSVEWQVSKSSRPLKRGEYVKAYSINAYDRTKVVQRKMHAFPVCQVEGTDDYVYAYADMALMPQLKFEYWNSSGRISGLSRQAYLVAIEYYEYKDGTYIKVKEVKY